MVNWTEVLNKIWNNPSIPDASRQDVVSRLLDLPRCAPSTLEDMQDWVKVALSLLSHPSDRTKVAIGGMLMDRLQRFDATMVDCALDLANLQHVLPSTLACKVSTCQQNAQIVSTQLNPILCC